MKNYEENINNVLFGLIILPQIYTNTISIYLSVNITDTNKFKQFLKFFNLNDDIII